MMVNATQTLLKLMLLRQDLRRPMSKFLSLNYCRQKDPVGVYYTEHEGATNSGDAQLCLHRVDNLQNDLKIYFLSQSTSHFLRLHAVIAIKLETPCLGVTRITCFFDKLC